MKEEDTKLEDFDVSLEDSNVKEKENNQKLSLADTKSDFRCEECGKQCKTEKHFINHKYYHKYYLNGEQELCEKCNKNIPKRLFARHLHTVHPDDLLEVNIP